ncbi:MAG: phosphopentomutase [Acidobacteria bacterium RIFCSPLOWO2_12_FULL_54_10]|nr:MAG: phosphopentomutase [Acidobacteria bacterium RIFCSPLOWO2_12_FULL_54_10]
MGPFGRVILIILDSVGIGAMPDAADYGDSGSDTLGNINHLRPCRLPNLCRLGLANIKPIPNLSAVPAPEGAYGKAALASPGKDTTTGHWEIAGIVLEKPFPTYPHGFPKEVIEAFEKAIGRKSLGNCTASGTEIIQQMGEEHVRTGFPIVYTSADSVFQIAAHEEIIPLKELYRMCEIARGILQGKHRVGRVIARPFVGSAGNFTRTTNRHDYAIDPPPGMLLDRLLEKGVFTFGVGKIRDIYCGRGLSDYVLMKGNNDGVKKTLEAMERIAEGFIFTNLVDFDSLYGHRNDIEGYARALEEFDEQLPAIREMMRPKDLLLITADHGCDPTTASTDHSREYVPLLACGELAGKGVSLGVRGSLADIGQTIAENFGTRLDCGKSFLKELAAVPTIRE